jgi:hypothetical protein
VTEKASVAVVSIVFIDGEGDEDDVSNIQVSGHGMTWTTEDMECARTLQQQLTGLLGEHVGEQILPMLAYGAIRDLPSRWPGSIALNKDDDD